MPRIARIVAPGLPHHITQRGNYNQNVFFNDSDRRQYLLWIQEYSRKFELSILSYCLMQNHVHFIVIPTREESIAKTFNCAHMRYSQYFNRKNKTTGHLWQGRFYSCILDESHLMSAARYIERNPVRADMVKEPWQWQWSSAQAHINNGASLFELGNLFKLIEISKESWKEFIDSKDDKNTLDNLRKHTLTGRPLGTVNFIKRLERKFGRRLVALPRGRPRKKE